MSDPFKLNVVYPADWTVLPFNGRGETVIHVVSVEGVVSGWVHPTDLEGIGKAVMVAIHLMGEAVWDTGEVVVK